MKVCTDACILGAWFAKKTSGDERILDIGSGTGLQLLMLAQQSKAELLGVELDKEACEQANENIGNSPWKERCKVEEGDIRTHRFNQRFDFIISNPPFFENDWASESDTEKVAKHSHSLSLSELLEVIGTTLSENGHFGILLPFHRWEYFDKLARQKGYYLQERLSIKQTDRHKPFRAILHYSKAISSGPQETELVIKPDGQTYSSSFEDLLRDYYLKL